MAALRRFLGGRSIVGESRDGLAEDARRPAENQYAQRDDDREGLPDAVAREGAGTERPCAFDDEYRGSKWTTSRIHVGPEIGRSTPARSRVGRFRPFMTEAKASISLVVSAIATHQADISPMKTLMSTTSTRSPPQWIWKPNPYATATAMASKKYMKVMAETSGPARIAKRLAGVYDELASRTGFRLTGGRERFRAVIPSRPERSLFELPAGVAAFAIERLGFVRQRPVEWRHTIVRGDRFSVVAEFSAGIGYRLDVGDTRFRVTIRMRQANVLDRRRVLEVIACR